MHTHLPEFRQSSPDAREAAAIIQRCVHCGFCNATCPTYQLLGDELDGPRGRIYQMKALLEGEATGRVTQQHLDRCLSCRGCETTCPSGVQYGRLLDIGRATLERDVPRPLWQRLERWVLRQILPYTRRFRMLMALARTARPLLPSSVRSRIPAPPPPHVHEERRPRGGHARRMLALTGCVQPVLAPAIDSATGSVLDRLGIELIRVEAGGCCGALSHHLSAHEEAKTFMRRNIDAWWPWIERGVEAIVINASGCGVMVREYAYWLRDDPRYAVKAALISDLTHDLVEILTGENLEPLMPVKSCRIAYQSPCTLQHGQQSGGRVEALLARLGFDLTPVADAHLCCGSAGTYTLLQPELSSQLLDRKLAALESGQPELIATANIGCLTQLQRGASLPVRHWVELLVE